MPRINTKYFTTPPATNIDVTSAEWTVLDQKENSKGIFDANLKKIATIISSKNTLLAYNGTFYAETKERTWFVVLSLFQPLCSLFGVDLFSHVRASNLAEKLKGYIKENNTHLNTNSTKFISDHIAKKLDDKTSQKYHAFFENLLKKVEKERKTASKITSHKCRSRRHSKKAAHIEDKISKKESELKEIKSKRKSIPDRNTTDLQKAEKAKLFADEAKLDEEISKLRQDKADSKSKHYSAKGKAAKLSGQKSTAKHYKWMKNSALKSKKFDAKMEKWARDDQATWKHLENFWRKIDQDQKEYEAQWKKYNEEYEARRKKYNEDFAKGAYNKSYFGGGSSSGTHSSHGSSFRGGFQPPRATDQEDLEKIFATVANAAMREGKKEFPNGYKITDRNSLNRGYKLWSLKNHPDRASAQDNERATELFKKVQNLICSVKQRKGWL